MIFIGILMYFGALLVPLIYFATTGWSGRAKKKMLLGIGLQLFWSLMVWGFVWYSWKNGYTEYYWVWTLLIPVNVVGLIWYVGCVFLPEKKPNQLPEPTSGLAPGRGSS